MGYFRRILPLSLILLLLLSACGTSTTGSQGKTSNSSSEPLVSLAVFVGSTFTGPLNDIRATYHDENPNVTITYHYNESPVLEQQLADNVPSDIFIAGDQATMKAASDANLVSAIQVFAKNKLVVIVPADNPMGLHTLNDLANKGVKLDVAPTTVPAGQSGWQLLHNLAQSPDYGVMYEHSVVANIVASDDNAYNIVQKVESGTVDAGIVYATDLTTLDENKVIDLPIPDQVNVFTEYPLALTKSSQHIGEAQTFMDYILSRQGQDILKKYNFLPFNQ